MFNQRSLDPDWPTAFGLQIDYKWYQKSVPLSTVCMFKYIQRTSIWLHYKLSNSQLCEHPQITIQNSFKVHIETNMLIQLWI